LNELEATKNLVHERKKCQVFQVHFQES